MAGRPGQDAAATTIPATPMVERMKMMTSLFRIFERRSPPTNLRGLIETHAPGLIRSIPVHVSSAILSSGSHANEGFLGPHDSESGTNANSLQHGRRLRNGTSKEWLDFSRIAGWIK